MSAIFDERIKFKQYTWFNFNFFSQYINFISKCEQIIIDVTRNYCCMIRFKEYNQIQQQNYRFALPMQKSVGMVDRPLEKTSSRSHFLKNMRQNIHELNRSMESIQKMIQQSRNIIQKSRQSSLNKSITIQRPSLNSTKKITLTPRVIDLLPHKNQQQTTTKKSDVSANHTESSFRGSHNRTRTTNFPQKNNNLIYATSPRMSNNSQKHKQNLLKFQPKIVKKEIQMKRSGVREKLGNSANSSDLIRIETVSNENEQNQAGPHQFLQGGNTIYKFSPQKTGNSKQKLSSKVMNSTPEGSSKIKIRPSAKPTNEAVLAKPQASKKPNSLKEEFKRKSNIKIEEDDEEFQDGVIEKEDASVYQLNYTDQIYRFKTEQKQRKQESDFSLSDYKLQSPQSSSYKKSNAKTKIKIQGGEGSVRMQKSSQSYRELKPLGIELIRETPRENRQVLVRELQELQSVSTSEQQRRAKFILKIKKYGFVQKYLTEGQIWAIYDQLVRSGVAELKWPIFIVDEVYKKMKTIK